MTEKTIKVGDVVPWADVPDGALVRQDIYAGRAPEFYYAARHGDRSYLCGVTIPLDEISQWYRARPVTPWDDTFSRAVDPPRVTVVALGLTGQESADDLRRMAERFDQARTYADASLAGPGGEDDETWRERLDDLWRVLDVEGIALAERMVAEDAARLLNQ